MKIEDYIEFNPKITINKKQLYKCIGMQDLQPYTRLTTFSEISLYKSGSKFQNGDTLFARITPCLENGKTSFVDCLNNEEIGIGSTEFLVCRAREGKALPLFVYYLLCSKKVRNVAISSMIGSSGRERVQEIALKEMIIPEFSLELQRHIVDIRRVAYDCL